MQAQPKVSVIMLAFNRPQFMGRAIQSVIEQTFSQWELIVVHDGPNEEIASLMKEWVQRDARIQYIHRPKPGNIAEATNVGLERAKGEYVAIQDDDDYWLQPDKLQKQVNFLDSHPDHSGCSGGVVVVDQFDKEKMRFYKPEHDAEIKKVALMANPMRHSAGMYRLQIARNFGGYDASLAGFQDWDVWLKLGQNGKLYNFQEYLTAYRVWDGSATFKDQRSSTAAGVRIVWRHRNNYPRFLPAISLIVMHHSYARTPLWFRQLTWKTLARIKRSLFSPKKN